MVLFFISLLLKLFLVLVLYKNRIFHISAHKVWGWFSEISTREWNPKWYQHKTVHWVFQIRITETTFKQAATPRRLELRVKISDWRWCWIMLFQTDHNTCCWQLPLGYLRARCLGVCEILHNLVFTLQGGGEHLARGGPVLSQPGGWPHRCSNRHDGKLFGECEGAHGSVAQLFIEIPLILTLQVAGFPSFRLYKKSGGELDFTGPRDLENFIKFVKTENENERKEEL